MKPKKTIGSTSLFFACVGYSLSFVWAASCIVIMLFVISWYSSVSAPTVARYRTLMNEKFFKHDDEVGWTLKVGLTMNMY